MATSTESTIRQERVSPHVLIMEDDANVAKGVEMVLNEQGYDVKLAGTGGLALEAFKQKRYDLLVADLRLPDMDGMEVIKQIKEETPDTEVVVITGYGTAAIAVEAMKLGAHDFLPKPFTDDQIRDSVGAALRSHGTPISTEKEQAEAAKLIQKREVINALNRTTEDKDFWQDLMENGPEALAAYNLSGQAKAAIASADLKWINENVGELTQKQLMFIHKRLEREAW